MNYLIIGAGNAGRPVARLLNYKNHQVTVTDPKELSEFKEDVQKILLQMYTVVEYFEGISDTELYTGGQYGAIDFIIRSAKVN